MPILVKEKPCKGTGKAKGHGCGEMQLKRTYGLGHDCGCLYIWARDTKEGNEFLKKRIIPKAKREVARNNKEETKRQKIESTNWINKLQSKVQEIARIIDFGHTCLARKTNGQMHGGHIFSKGGHAEMRLNLHNIHRQSAHSNKYNSDDGLLREQLSIEYGNEYWEFLVGLKKFSVPNYHNLDYYEFYKRACKIANRLKKNKEVLTVEERVSLRNEVNFELGIYSDEQCVFNL